MIKLYKNYVPNLNNNTYIYYTNINDYINHLRSKSGNPIEIENDKYTFTVNAVSVEMTLSDAKFITYISYEVNENLFFYHVTDFSITSGFVTFTVALDYWGTFIAYANISNMFVTRSNRNIYGATPIFDDIVATNERTFEQLLVDGATLLPLDKVAIIYVTIYSLGASTLFNNGASTVLQIYGNTLQNIQDMVNNVDIVGISTSLPYINILEATTSLISGIHSFIDTNNVTRDASIIRAFIVPTKLLDIVEYTEETQRARPQFESITRHALNPVYIEPQFYLRPNQKEFTVNVASDPLYKMYVGTKFDGLELTRTVGQTAVLFNCNVTNDDVIITARQGDKMSDITNGFACTLTTNDGNLTTMERIQKGLSTAQSVVGGVKQLFSGDIASGVLSLGGTIANSFSEGKGGYIKGGNAIQSFYREGSASTATLVPSPFYVTKYKSIFDDNLHAERFGAMTNTFTNLNVFFESAPIIPYTAQPPYITATVRISGVCSTACDVIREAFARGIYIEQA